MSSNLIDWPKVSTDSNLHRYYISKSNHMYMASEVGVTELEPSEIVSKVTDIN